MELHPKAIALGFVTALGLSFFVLPVATLLLGIGPYNPYYLHWVLVTGLIADGAAGAVTAWRSPSQKLSNAGALGLIVIGLSVLLVPFVTVPLWFNVSGFLLTIPACLAGGFVVLPDQSQPTALAADRRPRF